MMQYFYKSLFIFVLWGVSLCSVGQNIITGHFPQLANQQVNLFGFNGFETYEIESTRADDQGHFQLSYAEKDYGMGYLTAEDNKSYIVVLSGETIKLKGETLRDAATVEIVEGEENQLFGKYAEEHPRREQTLSAWGYLEKIYRTDSLFAKHNNPLRAIEGEKLRIKHEDSLFLANLPSGSYISWYLPVRKLISSVGTVAQYRTEEIPTTIAAFRNMNYTDARLYKSGLMRDAIESHVWLIENSGRPLDSMYVEMKSSIDKMIDNIVSDEDKLNEISEYLFKFLEKRSLFRASEYLALKLLNEKSCTLNNDFAAQLESYRAMKKGNTAPDILFTGEVIVPGGADAPVSLSETDADYKVVVFGASWCPQCQSELKQMASHYKNWKKYGVEVIFVSLDTEEQAFRNFAKILPFISICDFQKWESLIVKSYYVFATPTLYLLDANREIVLRPNSVKHLDSWVDWFLVKGNK